MAAAGRALPSAGRSKGDIRERVWEHLEASGLADFPRPVRGRIPNFKGSSHAATRLLALQEFRAARTVKINPDAPQRNARFLTLEARKTLLVPTPRLRTGLFNRIVPPAGATKEMLRRCATSQGVRDYSVPVGLDGKAQVDLVVVGSVAVSEKGWRIGKGEGYADMEYAMMVSMGAVQEDTPVVTIVHDCQVLDIAEELLGDHDLTVDFILTPTRTIQTNCKRPKPQGIMWHKVSSEMLGKIPILKTLRCREKQAGKDVTLQDEHPALANTKRAAISGQKVMAANPQPWAAPVGDPHDPGNPKFQGSDTITTVYVGNLPGSLRVSQLKSALRELQVVPVALKWQGAQHRAFLEYRDQGAAHRAVASLQGLSLGGSALRVELAKSSKGQGEIHSHK
ncbi:methenyltetrahydrofolate synthase domain-containing protein isoform X2 [Passer montanus]|uniref:methenyltetrahydrofolate synthase domain-containing protein isoform X2 n=1 Tax=Passer montanus TaxID=9160 RepID=UPI00195F763B|nr:methenyltetrahydrofolate synthase domain-containing protein isoform X2 [Passer montanus]